MGKRLFLSYAREDAEPAEQIRSALEAAGHDVWVDEAGIQGGDRWRAVIVAAIEEADEFVLVLSTHSVGSNNVLAEVQIASEQGTPILPVRLDDAKITGGLRYTLVGLQTIDLHTDASRGLVALLVALGASPQPTPVDSQPPAPTTPSWAWAVGGVAVASVAVFSIVLLNRPSTPTTTTAPPTTTSRSTTTTASRTTTTILGEPIVGQQVNSEDLEDEFGIPVLAINFARQPSFGCGENGCSYAGGFFYKTPPDPAEFQNTPTCDSTGYATLEFLGLGQINIGRTDHDAVFWTHRWGNVEYEFDIAPGRYLVVLRFTELDVDDRPDSRLFTAAVEGMESEVIDIEGRVGLDVAFDLGWQVEIGADQKLNVRLFPGDADCPSLYAMVVFEDLAD